MRFYQIIGVLFFLVSVHAVLAADSYDVGGGSYRVMREIDVPGGKASVVVTQFMHQGLINLNTKGADPRVDNAGKTVLVTTKTKKPVPFKILQLGPGDYCRLAIQNDEKTGSYVVYYGVPAGRTPNKGVAVPQWTSDAGLLFETRWADSGFSMDDLESLKRAFERSRPIGADYVKNVFHGYNPMTFRREPFLSRYTGNLYVTKPGRYAILTSSHHCSFLLIDGKIVASHPGRHGRAWQARPELVKQVNLSEGKHSFEYYHATADDQASMLAVWELNSGEKPKFETIPAEAFHADDAVRALAGPPSFADQPGATDFDCRIIGNVPLPENDQQMIGVQFSNKTAGLAKGGKMVWSFGDGQTSEEAHPMHIYLKPGLYHVQLVSDTGNHRFAATNRIEVDQPHQAVDKEKLPTLDDYLAVLEKYDASKLDADSLLQLIEAYQFKIDSILNPTAEELARMTEPTDSNAAEKGGKKEKKPASRQRSVDLEQVSKFRRLMAETVRSALTDNPNFKGDGSVYKLALTVGGIARDYLLDWKLAGQIYVAAGKKLMLDDYSAECFALAADVSLDMQNKTAAKNFLDVGEKKVSKTGVGQPISTFYRVKAEYLAEAGNPEEARKAIQRAAAATGGGMQYSEKVALQGSASRSAENFLQEKNYDRMIESLRTWQMEYPAAVYDGYVTLLFAKYWIGREKYALAASLADRQLTLNPDSPYIDELLLVASEAKEKEGNKEAARSYLSSLLKNYPGSAFVPDAKQRLEKLK